MLRFSVPVSSALAVSVASMSDARIPVVGSAAVALRLHVAPAPLTNAVVVSDAIPVRIPVPSSVTNPVTASAAVPGVSADATDVLMAIVPINVPAPVANAAVPLSTTTPLLVNAAVAVTDDDAPDIDTDAVVARLAVAVIEEVPNRATNSDVVIAPTPFDNSAVSSSTTLPLLVTDAVADNEADAWASLRAAVVSVAVVVPDTTPLRLGTA